MKKAIPLVILLFVTTLCACCALSNKGDNQPPNSPILDPEISDIGSSNIQLPTENSDNIQGSWKATCYDLEGEVIDISDFLLEDMPVDSDELKEEGTHAQRLFTMLANSTWNFNDDGTFNMLLSDAFYNYSLLQVDLDTLGMSESEWRDGFTNAFFPMCNGTWEKRGVLPTGGNSYMLTTIERIFDDGPYPLELTVKENELSVLVYDPGQTLYFSRSE